MTRDEMDALAREVVGTNPPPVAESVIALLRPVLKDVLPRGNAKRATTKTRRATAA